MSRGGLLTVRAIIGIALIVYLAVSGAIDWSSLLGLIEAWRLSLASLGLLFTVVALVAWRLCILLGAQGLALPFTKSLRLTLIGAFFNAFLPGAAGGDVARVYLATKPNPGHRTEIATIVLLDRAIGFFALMVLPLLVALALGASYEWPASVRGLLRFAGLAAIVLCVAALTAHSHGPLRRTVTRALGWIRLDRHAELFFDTVYAYRNQPAALLTAFLLSLLIQALAVSAIVLPAIAIGAGPISWRLALTIPFGMLANSLPLTPGGIGVGEAAFEVLFRSVGAAGGAQTILAWRVLTTLLDLAGGSLLLIGHTDMSMVKRMTATADDPRPMSADVDDGAI